MRLAGNHKRTTHTIAHETKRCAFHPSHLREHGKANVRALYFRLHGDDFARWLASIVFVVLVDVHRIGGRRGWGTGDKRDIVFAVVVSIDFVPRSLGNVGKEKKYAGGIPGAKNAQRIPSTMRKGFHLVLGG